MTSYTRIVEIIELLAERWPLAFAVYEQRRQPLQLQIRDQILAALGDAVTLGELSAALGYYTGNYVYLKRTQVGTPRIGLDGQPAGNVTEDEAAHAAEVLAKRTAKWQARKAQVAQDRLRAESVAATSKKTILDRPVLRLANATRAAVGKTIRAHQKE